MMRNWGGNVSFEPEHVFMPANTKEVMDLVGRAGEQKKSLRVIGAGHSFSPLIATDQWLVDLKNIGGLISIDEATMTATFGAGCSVRRLTQELWSRGLALANQGDINHQTIAGAISTGTHGTGIQFGSLSAFVTGLEFVDGNGELQSVSADKDIDLLRAAQVQLGTFGVLTKVSLQCERRFVLRDHRRTVALETCLQELKERVASHRHLEFFWFPYSKYAQIKALDVVAERRPRSMVGAFVSDELIERVLYQSLCEVSRQVPAVARHTSKLCGSLMPGSDYADWSYRVFPSSRKVRFTEMEYALPIEAGVDCFRELKRMIEGKKLNVFFPVEFRVAAADEAWLSPFYGRQSAILSLHVYKQVDQERFFAEAEAIFRQFGGRPHWGKIHHLTPALISDLYPRWDEFSALRQRFDPQGLFLNKMLRAYFV